MSISTKTALPILLMAILLSLSAYLIQRHLILPAFSDIEMEQAKDNIDRVIRRLQGELKTVDFTVYDWSSWDDTYRFMEDRNEAYIASNLNADTFWNYGLEVALLMNLKGEPVWAGIYDFQAEESRMVQTEQYLEDLQAKAKNLSQQIDLEEYIDDRKVTGVLSLNDTPVLYSMRPIHLSDGTGAPRGFVLFGQRLTEDRVAELSRQIVLNFKVQPVSQQARPETETSYEIQPLSDERLLVTKLLSVNDKAQLKATITLERSITNLGWEITLYSISVFTLLSLALSIMLLILFRTLVVRPIVDLKTDISSISSAMDYSMRAQIRNEDEIGSLSREFNAMLSVIESNNEELKKLSEIDPLTGLFNRLALDKKLRQTWSILTRTGDPLTVLLVDIDHFKAYNDRYGHPAGDACLKFIANILNHAGKREADMVARYGGEEFIILLPSTGTADAARIATDLLKSLATANIEHTASPVAPHVTVSIGGATVVPSSEHEITDLISLADKALYKVKEAGRNGVEIQPLA